MSNTFDVIVIGVGAMGAAACWRLAARGCRVLGLDQNGIPNSMGSSHGYTRMTRAAYYEHPDYVPLVRRANDLWRELESQTGLELLHHIGALYMGAPSSELIAGSKLSADEHHVEYEMLTREALAKQFPQFHVPDSYVGMREFEAGFLRPELCISAMASQAMQSGAELHGCERVIDWAETQSTVTVRTNVSEYEADEIVFAGGAWSADLLRNLGVPLVVTRQVLGWVWPRRPELFDLGKLPVWAVGHDDGTMHYGFPMLADNPGLKVAHHSPGRAIDPNAGKPAAIAEDEESFRPFLEQTVPQGAGPVIAMRICMYTLSPDRHFIVGRLAASERVTVACGFSGHGFKFASAIGEALADLAIEDRSPLPIGFLGLDRFALQS